MEIKIMRDNEEFDEILFVKEDCYWSKKTN